MEPGQGGNDGGALSPSQLSTIHDQGRPALVATSEQCGPALGGNPPLLICLNAVRTHFSGASCRRGFHALVMCSVERTTIFHRPMEWVGLEGTLKMV